MAGQAAVGGKHWGNFASAALMPNGAQNQLATTTHPPWSLLQPGDLAFLTTQGATYQCASVGTAGGGDAAWSAIAVVGNVTTAASIAGLRAINGGVVTVLVDVYSSVGDGGGGWFVWDGTQPIANDNGGTIIAPTLSNVGCWMRQDALATRVWNARWFGAKGDNATDDTAALNALFHALSLRQTPTPDGVYYGAGVGYLPTGVYRCSSQVTICQNPLGNASFHMSLVGDGMRCSILRFDNVNGNGVVATDYPDNFSSQVRIAELGIYGTSNANTGAAIYFKGGADCLVERVFSSGFFECVELNGQDTSVVRDCVFGGGGSNYGVPASAGSIGVALRGDANVITIECCQFNGTGINVLHAGGIGHWVRGCNSEGGILGRIQSANSVVHEQWTQEGQNVTDTSALFHFDSQGAPGNVLVGYDITIRDCFLGGSVTRDTVKFDPTAVVYYFAWERNHVANSPPTGVITIADGRNVNNPSTSVGDQTPAAVPLFQNAPAQWVDLNAAPTRGYYVTGSVGSPQLPASAQVGTVAYAYNGRKVGQGPGQGTGVSVYFSSGAWRVLSTDQPVAF